MIVNLAKRDKSKSDHQYINGVDSNPAKGRTKKMSAKNLTLPLLRRFYKKNIYYSPVSFRDPMGVDALHDSHLLEIQ